MCIPNEKISHFVWNNFIEIQAQQCVQKYVGSEFCANRYADWLKNYYQCYDGIYAIMAEFNIIRKNY